MLLASSIVDAAGLFFYSALAIAVAGMAFFLVQAARALANPKPSFVLHMEQLARWVLAAGMLNALFGILHFYRITGYNFALADQQTIYAGISVMVCSMAGALVVIVPAFLAGRFFKGPA